MAEKLRAAELRVERLHTCPCGKRAVRYTAGGWSCLLCIQKDAAFYGVPKRAGVRQGRWQAGEVAA